MEIYIEAHFQQPFLTNANGKVSQLVCSAFVSVHYMTKQKEDDRGESVVT